MLVMLASKVFYYILLVFGRRFSMRMKAYQLTNRGRTYPTFIVDSNGQFQTSLEEFKRAYGFNRLDRRDRDAYMRDLTNSRLSLFKDKARLHLRCNPMTDDLALVFSEW